MTEHLVRNCSLPLAREETFYGDALPAAEGVKRFTTGTDRMRLNRGGEASGLPEHYQTILISTANVSLRELVATVDDPASRRIFELDMREPESDYFEHLTGISADMLRNRGFAGRRYAQILTCDDTLALIHERLSGTADHPGSTILKYRQVLASIAQDRYIVGLLAACDIGARLAVHWGLLAFDVDRIMQWGIKKAMLYTGPAGEGHEIEEAMRHFTMFLSDHQAAVLVVNREWLRGKAPLLVIREPRAGLVARLETETGKMYVLTQAVKDWCMEKRIYYPTLIESLIAHRIVVERSRKHTLGAGTSFPSTQAACLEVNMQHAAMTGIVTEVPELKQA